MLALRIIFAVFTSSFMNLENILDTQKTIHMDLCICKYLTNLFCHVESAGSMFLEFSISFI